LSRQALVLTFSKHRIDDFALQKREITEQLTQLASLNMYVDIVERRLSVKDVVSNVFSYLPKESMGTLDKIMGKNKTKDAAERYIEKLSGHSSLSVKVQFLNVLELKTDLLMESFDAKLVTDGSNPVQIQVKPPFKSMVSKFSQEERDATIELYDGIRGALDSKKKDQQSRKVIIECPISELSHATTGNNELSIQLFRKTGVPLTLEISSLRDSWDLKSLICGYYRLIEKWSFSLCNDIVYPSLQFHLSHSIHGPVSDSFIAQKFATKGSGRMSPYLLQQDPQNHSQINLHFIQEKTRKTLVISKNEEEEYVITCGTETKSSASFKELIKSVKDGVFQSVVICDCLHPSEFDRDTQLLLCRISSKSDELQRSLRNNDFKVAICFNHLSQVKNEDICNGKFTRVTTAIWRGHPDGVPRKVALKQLKPEFQKVKLESFSQLCYDVLSWNEGTMIKSFGICLNTRVNPMTLVLEHFPLGTLDSFLKTNSLEDVDLMEAVVSLSRALWFLDENGIVHGNIRCSNVFVAESTSTAFKVKLGDRGLFDAYDRNQVSV
jgi:Janus kinase 2